MGGMLQQIKRPQHSATYGCGADIIWIINAFEIRRCRPKLKCHSKLCTTTSRWHWNVHKATVQKQKLSYIYILLKTNHNHKPSSHVHLSNGCVVGGEEACVSRGLWELYWPPALAPGRFNQAGQVSDEGPDETQHTWRTLHVGGWAWGWQHHPVKQALLRKLRQLQLPQGPPQRTWAWHLAVWPHLLKAYTRKAGVRKIVLLGPKPRSAQGHGMSVPWVRPQS